MFSQALPLKYKDWKSFQPSQSNTRFQRPVALVLGWDHEKVEIHNKIRQRRHSPMEVNFEKSM